MAVVLLTLVFMVAFAVGSGMIADRKGRNFLLFAALGFLFGIFGLLIAAVVPRKKPAYS